MLMLGRRITDRVSGSKRGHSLRMSWNLCLDLRTALKLNNLRSVQSRAIRIMKPRTKKDATAGRAWNKILASGKCTPSYKRRVVPTRLVPLAAATSPPAAPPVVNTHLSILLRDRPTDPISLRTFPLLPTSSPPRQSRRNGLSLQEWLLFTQRHENVIERTHHSGRRTARLSE